MRRGFGLVGVGLLLVACGGPAGVVETPAASPAAPTTLSPCVFVMQGVNDGAGRLTGAVSVVSIGGNATAIACAELRGG